MIIFKDLNNLKGEKIKLKRILNLIFLEVLGLKNILLIKKNKIFQLMITNILITITIKSLVNLITFTRKRKSG